MKQTVRQVGRGLKQFELKTQTYQAWLYLFQEARKEAHILALIFKNHCEDLLNKIIAKRIAAYQRYKRKCLIAYSNSFWSSAIISVLRNWITDNMRIAEEDLAAMDLPLLPF